MSEPPSCEAGATCPQCATWLPCQAPATSRYFGCATCRTFFSFDPTAAASVARALGHFEPTAASEPCLPLGAVGELAGHRCRIGGYQVLSDQRDPRSAWGTYELQTAAPQPGCEPADFPLQLVEYQGHWLLIRRAQGFPDTHGPRSAQDGRWVDTTGRAYRVWRRYQPLVRVATGEFDRNILADEGLLVAEYTSPPYLLVSMQPPEQLPSWYLAEYLEPAQVATAFGVSVGQLPVRQGVGAAQPSPLPGWPHLRRLALAVAVLLTALQIALLASRPTYRGEQQFLLIEPDRGSHSRLLTSNPFVVAEPAALAIELEIPDLENHWVEIAASLVNEQTGHAYEFTRRIEYHEGVTSQGRWTANGGRTATVVLGALPSGRYHFNFYPTFEKGTAAVALNLHLAVNTPLWSNYLLVLGGLMVLPVGVWLRRLSFEQARWRPSEYGPEA